MIVITEATGQLGRAVVKQLAKRVAAERIGVFVRDERKAADLNEQSQFISDVHVAAPHTGA